MKKWIDTHTDAVCLVFLFASFFALITLFYYQGKKDGVKELSNKICSTETAKWCEVVEYRVNL